MDELTYPLQLYTYYRSTCAYRVRIALNLKQLTYEAHPIDLTLPDTAPAIAAYRTINPQGLVPALMAGRRALTQSLAIIEYLEECYPQPALLPATARDRARVRSLAQVISCDIQPMNSYRVQYYLQENLALSNEQKNAWCQQWLVEGFYSLEQELSHSLATGTYCHGDSPTLADICLIPQVYTALQYELDMTPYPTIQRIYDECLWIEAFQQAAPEQQPDAPNAPV